MNRVKQGLLPVVIMTLLLLLRATTMTGAQQYGVELMVTGDGIFTRDAQRAVAIIGEGVFIIDAQHVVSVTPEWINTVDQWTSPATGVQAPNLVEMALILLRPPPQPFHPVCSS